ncbi:glucan-binding protein [Lewinellaceae bacterium SD302]|nr:glucan-binding protein [Lewinellaceae bacterium SD302]
MFRLFYLLVATLLMTTLTNPLMAQKVKPIYHLVIRGYDWGPAVNKVILPLNGNTEGADKKKYKVEVSRAFNDEKETGERKVIGRYFSDEAGNRKADGDHLTLTLSVGPNEPLANPFQYLRGRNRFIDYQVVVTDGTGGRWTEEDQRLFPDLEPFELDGKYEDANGGIMKYAYAKPLYSQARQPLLIWLHGGGEGGTDPRVPLLANRAANYASPEIQTHFGGAYVLVPQAAGAWMHNASGVSTWGKENDVYNEALMALIREFVAQHPDVDKSRIYVGGCSNGGYMSVKLMLLYPDYFAAGFPSALAYRSEYLSDEDIVTLAQTPSWYIHSKDDPVTPADATVVPVYERLMATGATNQHLSLFEHVVDLSGFYGGDAFHYNGHFSWVYSHTNQCFLDYDGQPVRIAGQPVSLMEWLAAQRR